MTEGVIYPHLIGSDIGCGLALFQTGMLRREAKVERWSELRFNLKHPWDEFVSRFLTEQELESTEAANGLAARAACACASGLAHASWSKRAWAAV